MKESKKFTGESKISRERMVQLLNEDLSREYQAMIAYTVYSQTMKGARLTISPVSSKLMRRNN
jgi:stress-induced morphogen